MSWRVFGKKEMIFLDKFSFKLGYPGLLNLEGLSVAKVKVHFKMIELAIFYNINLLILT